MGEGRGAWRIHGISVQGYRHRQTGTPCQDACDHVAIGPSDARVTVLAVADGAGSRPRSEEGSQLAVKLATSYFGDRAAARPPAGKAMHELLMTGFREVRAQFLRKVGDRPDDFATTLTVVLMTRDWLGHLSVGDGFVVVRAGAENGERQYHLLPQSKAVSEYSNETVFLTSPGAEEWVLTDCVRDPGIDGVLLSTDGLAQAALSWSAGRPREPNASFATAIFRSLDDPRTDPDQDRRTLAALLQSDQLTRLNADDKTLLRAVRP